MCVFAFQYCNINMVCNGKWYCIEYIKKWVENGRNIMKKKFTRIMQNANENIEDKRWQMFGNRTQVRMQNQRQRSQKVKWKYSVEIGFCFILFRSDFFLFIVYVCHAPGIFGKTFVFQHTKMCFCSLSIFHIFAIVCIYAATLYSTAKRA